MDEFDSNADATMSSPLKQEERPLLELELEPPLMVLVESSDSTHVDPVDDFLDHDALKRDMYGIYQRVNEMDFQGTLRRSHVFIYENIHRALKSDDLKSKLMSAAKYEKEVSFESVEDALQHAFREDDWLSYVNLRALRDKPKPLKSMSDAELEATFKSWSSSYTDQGILEGFKTHVRANFVKKKHDTSRLYARLVPLIQSSGSGKSRMTDELAKSILLITVNVRDPSTTGFPAPDPVARDFLLGPDPKSDTSSLSYLRCLAFLFATFVHTLEVLGPFGDYDSEKTPSLFRSHMLEGETPVSVGENRKRFYSAIVRQAREVVARYPSSESLERLKNEVQEALLSLLRHMVPTLREDRILLRSEPMLYIVIDEAHVLTTPFHDETLSCFTEMRRALNAIVAYPVLAIVISTTGAISSYSPATRRDPSSRLQRGEFHLMPPWCTLGFDHFVTQEAVNKLSTLADVTTLDFFSRFGRPLWHTRYINGDQTVREQLVKFALEKLLLDAEPVKLTEADYFALLAQRLPIELNFSGYTAREQNLVENHLRVCLAVHPSRETIATISASETILSEAASLFMRTNKNFKMVQGLQDVVTGYSINQGDRGELLSAAIFTQVRDSIVVKRGDDGEALPTFSVADFMSTLLSEKVLALIPSQADTPELKSRSLAAIFSKSSMHFNHFVKPNTHEMGKNRLHLLSFIMRGAALQGANGQPGWDQLLPFLYEGDHLLSDNGGFILAQIKNDADIGFAQAQSLFDRMDPFKLGLFTESNAPVPIIRLIFSMACKVPKMTQYFPPPNAPPARFTSFDFVCEGLGPSVFPVIKDNSEASAWDAALRMTPLNALMKQQKLLGGKRMHPLGDEGHSVMILEEAVQEVEMSK